MSNCSGCPLAGTSNNQFGSFLSAIVLHSEPPTVDWTTAFDVESMRLADYEKRYMQAVHAHPHFLPCVSARLSARPCSVGSDICSHSHRPGSHAFAPCMLTCMLTSFTVSICIVRHTYCTVLYCTVLYCTVLYCTTACACRCVPQPRCKQAQSSRSLISTTCGMAWSTASAIR
jgi:hypothetical protein